MSATNSSTSGRTRLILFRRMFLLLLEMYGPTRPFQTLVGVNGRQLQGIPSKEPMPNFVEGMLGAKIKSVNISRMNSAYQTPNSDPVAATTILLKGPMNGARDFYRFCPRVSAASSRVRREATVPTGCVSSRKHAQRLQPA